VERFDCLRERKEFRLNRDRFSPRLSLRSTDLNDSLARVMSDTTGYYLLGFRPSPGTVAAEPDKASFHSISVKLKRKGLNLRARSGFAGVPDEPATASKTPDEQLTDALLSPFASGGVRVRLTPLFRERNGLLVQSLVHVEAADLQFAELEAGYHIASVDLALASLGEDGSPIGKVSRRFDIRLSGADYKRALETGIVYNLAHNVKPGVYQWRAAVRDVASGRTGAARQFIEVPDLAKGRLAVGGILIHQASTGSSENARSGPAYRDFALGSIVEFEYPVFNAGRLNLQAQARVFRDGKEIWAGKPAPLTDSSGAGRLDPGTVSQSGQYLLEVTVVDKTGRKSWK
jgi:hypothetical protein